MAIFNPNVPDTNDPNWLGWSKSVTQPQPDTSTGETLSNIGSGFKEAVTASDALLKENTQDLARAGATKLQEEFTSNLEKNDISIRIAAAAGPGGRPTAGGSGGPGVPVTGNSTSTKAVYDAPPISLLAPNPQENQPRELQNLPSNLEALDSARGNGKLSDTAYTGRLVALAKELRSRYRGYEEYIDNEIHKVTGINPAHHYINSLLGDLNSFVNIGKEVDTKIRNELWQHLGLPGVDAILSKYNAGGFGSPRDAEPLIMSALAPTLAIKKQLEMRKALREDATGQREEVAASTENEVNTALRLQSVTAFESLHLLQGQPTAQQISKLITDVNSGALKVTDEQAQHLAGGVRSLKFQADQEMERYLNTQGKDGRTIRTILGDTKVNALKTSHLKQFDDVADMLNSKEYGLANRAMNTLRAQGNDDTLELVSQPELGKSMRMLKTIHNFGSDKITKEALQTILEGGLGNKFQEYIKLKQGEMVTQPGAAEGKPSTLNEAITTLQQRTSNPAGPSFSKAEVAKTTESLLKNIDIIPKITDPRVKEGLATAVFDPKNLGLLTKFDEDQYKDGRFIPGKFSVFNRMYDEEMTKTLRGLGGQHWENYKDLGKQMWGRELFGPFLQRFTNASANPIQDNPDVRITYDSDNFKLKAILTGPPSAARDNFKNYLQSNFDRLNNSFGKVANIAKAEGTDPNTMMLGWMREFGVDVGRLPGIPQKILDAIVTSKQEETKTQEEQDKRYGAKPKPKSDNTPMIRDKALPYNEEQAPSSGNLGGGSLSDWLAHPAGVVAQTRNNAPAASSVASRGIVGAGKRRSINLSDQNITDVHYEPEQRYNIGR